VLRAHATTSFGSDEIWKAGAEDRLTFDVCSMLKIHMGFD